MRIDHDAERMIPLRPIVIFTFLLVPQKSAPLRAQKALDLLFELFLLPRNLLPDLLQLFLNFLRPLTRLKTMLLFLPLVPHFTFSTVVADPHLINLINEVISVAPGMDAGFTDFAVHNGVVILCLLCEADLAACLGVVL